MRAHNHEYQKTVQRRQCSLNEAINGTMLSNGFGGVGVGGVDDDDDDHVGCNNGGVGVGVGRSENTKLPVFDMRRRSAPAMRTADRLSRTEQILEEAEEATEAADDVMPSSNSTFYVTLDEC